MLTPGADYMPFLLGIITACLILPIWANWRSDGEIRLAQRGIAVPFIVGLMLGVPGSIGLLVTGQGEYPSVILLSLASGVAVLVLIVKCVRGHQISKEDLED
ncbi:hypothetical protein ACFLVE_03805 [Chloroflexota bacterium]